MQNFSVSEFVPLSRQISVATVWVRQARGDLRCGNDEIYAQGIPAQALLEGLLAPERRPDPVSPSNRARQLGLHGQRIASLRRRNLRSFDRKIDRAAAGPKQNLPAGIREARRWQIAIPYESSLLGLAGIRRS